MKIYEFDLLFTN